ncbi:hypothetical protein [Mesorhizobium sp. SP-1A]|uniref:hypothetical protein n=1 Tax=Mesorhizobium sp. SP-1A TaxID=3077840 RepID=UPI0028F711AD|nr:hypothetical protein [Mesorhizobium sp. SP-1A]
MTVFTKRAVQVFAPTAADGSLRSPDMGDAILWGTEVERGADGAAAGRVDQSTWAGLAAITGTRPGQPAVVFGPDAGTHTDPVAGGTVANTGEYYWSIAPAGWRRAGNLQRTLVHAINTGGGTPNAVRATSDVQFSQTAYSALITVNFVAANGPGGMTVSINGELPRPLVTNTADPIPAAYVKAGMSALIQMDGAGNYRLFSYGDASAIEAAVEALLLDAQAAAQAAADAAAAVASAPQWAFKDKSAAALFNPAVPPAFISLAGYGAAGDGGAAVYKKVAVEPTHTGKVQDGAGNWYELATDRPHVAMFGGGTGTPATDGAAFERMIAYVRLLNLKGIDIFAPPGTYQMSAGVDLPTGNRWHLRGVRLDFTGVANGALVPMYVGQNNTHVACRGAKVGIPNLAANVSKGQFIVPFATPHGMKSGDVIEIYNPTDSSWSIERVYYRAGELARVMVAPDATTVWLDRGLYADYLAANVVVSKYLPWTGDLDGLHIIGNGSRAVATYGIATDIATDFLFSRVSAERVSYNTHSIGRSFDFKLAFCRGGEDGIVDFGGDYGLGIYSAQRGVIEDSHFIAARHAITHGNVDGSVPFRDIRFDRCSARSFDLTPGAATFGWDYHAIGEDCSMVDCVAETAVNDGCLGLTIERCKLYNLPGWEFCYQASHQIGGVTRLLDNEYWVNGSIATPTFRSGIIHLATSQTHTKLFEDKTYEIRGVTIRGNNQRAENIVALLTQNTTYRVSVDISGVDDPDINATRQNILYADGLNLTPIAPRRLAVRNIKRARSGVALAKYDRTMPAPLACDYEPQEGTAGFPSGTGATAESAITFRYPYPESPRVFAQVNDPPTLNSGANFPVGFARAITATGFTLRSNTNSYVAYAASVQLTAGWRASLTRHGA